MKTSTAFVLTIDGVKRLLAGHRLQQPAITGKVLTGSDTTLGPACRMWVGLGVVPVAASV